MNEPEKPKKGWGLLQWTVVVGGVILAVTLMIPVPNLIITSSYRQRQASQGREILMALKIFANDCKSRYPDAWGINMGSANKSFRALVRERVVMDESMFGGLMSPYYADGQVGADAGYETAVGPGENHWMMLGGLGTFVHPTHPLIYENALDADWPPKWSSEPGSKPIRGRVWHGGKILVGLNDGSISIIKLRQVDDALTLPESMLLGHDGKPWDDIQVLDIEERKDVE